MDIDKDALWYALHVRPRFEKVIARNLKGKGYEEFLPLLRRHNRWSDRVKEIDLPMFPGYVFCKFNALYRLPLLTIPGVNLIVGVGKSPMPVEERELDAIRAVMQSGVYCEPWPFMPVGQTVRVEHGPFIGTEGIVTAHKNTYRLIISVNLLQRSVAVEIDGDCLKPIGSPKSASSEPSAPVLKR